MATYTKPQQWKKERKKTLKGQEGREIKYSILNLDLKDGKLWD